MLPIEEKLITSQRRPWNLLKSVKGIVIHWTANSSEGANALAQWAYYNQFNDRRKASAHYLVDDQQIIQCIPDEEMAYHLGTPREIVSSYVREEVLETPGESLDHYFLGIEICVNSDGILGNTRKLAVELIRHLMERFDLDISQVMRHSDITGHGCPRLIIEGEEDWMAFLEEVMAVPLSRPVHVAMPNWNSVVNRAFDFLKVQFPWKQPQLTLGFG